MGRIAGMSPDLTSNIFLNAMRIQEHHQMSLELSRYHFTVAHSRVGGSWVSRNRSDSAHRCDSVWNQDCSMQHLSELDRAFVSGRAWRRIWYQTWARSAQLTAIPQTSASKSLVSGDQRRSHDRHYPTDTSQPIHIRPKAPCFPVWRRPIGHDLYVPKFIWWKYWSSNWQSTSGEKTVYWSRNASAIVDVFDD